MRAARYIPVLMLLALCAGRWPTEGGRVTIYVDESPEDVGVIGEALRSRLLDGFFVHPSGYSAAIRLSGDADLRDSWIIERSRAFGASPDEIVASLTAASHEVDGPWHDLASCRVGGDGEVRLYFERPVCDPTLRFALRPLPGSRVRSSFLETSEWPDLFRKSRFFEKPAFLARLDEIAIVQATAPPRPAPDEVVISEPVECDARCESLCLTYRLVLDPATVTEGGAAWMKALLSADAFAPLIESERRCDNPIDQTDGHGGASFIAPPEFRNRTLQLADVRSERDALIGRRIRSLLARSGVPVTFTFAGVDVPDAVRARLDRVVLFDSDPLKHLRLECGEAFCWTVLSARYQICYGSRVVGTLTRPDQLWLLPDDAGGLR